MMMKPIIIGVAGGSGSGKTTIVDIIMKALGNEDVVVIRHDDYYSDQTHMPMDERVLVNYDHPLSFDNDLFIEHIQMLIKGQAIAKPMYDFTVHNRSPKTETVRPAKVIILEGILLLEEARIRDLMDIKVYVETDPDLRFIRRLERDIHERGRSVDSVVKQYLETVKPMHYQFVAPSKRHADIMIPNHYKHSVAVDMMITTIKSILQTQGDDNGNYS
jgi:uridine kinase